MIVVKAGAAGLALSDLRYRQIKKNIVAMDNLEAGGSTACGAGITLAYKVARKNLK